MMTLHLSIYHDNLALYGQCVHEMDVSELQVRCVDKYGQLRRNETMTEQGGLTNDTLTRLSSHHEEIQYLRHLE